jgi:rRNA maturation protein Nop10
MHIQIRVSHDGKLFEGSATLSEVGSRAGSQTKNPTPEKPEDVVTKPAGALDTLYAQGYFASERTLAEVRAQLQHNGYNFGAPSVLMALQAREYLQRRGSKGSYRFVQKYPTGGA